MKVYAKSDIGNVRSENQDNFSYGKFLKDGMWFLICDGMGGANGGKLASNLLSEKIKLLMKDFNEKSEKSVCVKDLLEDMLAKSNLLIFNESKKNKAYEGMGTTAVLSIIINGKLYIAHVGDSRAYIIKDKKIKQLTIDHSIVQEMLNIGKITAEEAKDHPQKNIITKAIVIREEVEPDFVETDFEDGNILFMCTDGLTGYLDERNILDIILKEKLENIVDTFILKAKELGGKDNITVILACS